MSNPSTPLPEQGGFNELLEKIFENFEPLKYTEDNGETFKEYMSVAEAKAAIRTLVLEEIIGENELSYSIPQGMPESVYNRFKGADNLRAEQRKKLEDTNGTK